MSQSTSYRILVSPLYDMDKDILDALHEGIREAFGYPTESISLLKDLKFAYDASRNQYLSTSILDKLGEKAPSCYLKVLAIVDVDLFIPILTHVYGEAQLGGRACIISTYRLNQGIVDVLSSKRYVCRVRKEALHELGHTFNLRHCREKSCIMHYCRRIEDVDEKSEEFCRYCKIMLNDEIKRLNARQP